MHTFYINLARRPDRDDAFRRANSHLSGVTKCLAVDGQSIDRDRLRERGVLGDALETYSNGAIGNALSHRGLWRWCDDQNEPITILEDDIHVHQSFQKESEEIVRTLPADWDIILWGWNADVPVRVSLFGGGLNASISMGRDKLGADVDRFKYSRESRSTLRLIVAFGISGYSISPQGARNMLQTCFPLRTEVLVFPQLGLRVGNRWLDAAMCKGYSKMNAFCCFPPLAWTENDISNSDVNKPVVVSS